MNFDTIALLTFILFLCVFMIKTHKRLQMFSWLKIFYFGMYRTKLGMTSMERWARKHESWLTKAGYLMIPTGFIGMLIMLEELVRGTIALLQNSDALTVGVVLPIQAKGVFYVPFVYWIISILFIMIVHEFGHGIIARAHKVRVKSTGFAFLGALIPIVPGAFVEIDEKHLAKQNKYTQLSIFAAGPFVNIVFGMLFFVALLVLQPMAQSMMVSEGVSILQVAENSPAAITGLTVGDLITQINDMPIHTAQDFEKAFITAKAGDTAQIMTSAGSKQVLLGGTTKAYLGVQVEETQYLNPAVAATNGIFWPSVFVRIVQLLFWLFALNLGVGLFNLIPIGPIDGGRMFHTALQHVVHHKHARTVWHAVSAVLLIIIVGTVISAFV